MDQINLMCRTLYKFTSDIVNMRPGDLWKRYMFTHLVFKFVKKEKKKEKMKRVPSFMVWKPAKINLMNRRSNKKRYILRFFNQKGKSVMHYKYRFQRGPGLRLFKKWTWSKDEKEFSLQGRMTVGCFWKILS